MDMLIADIRGLMNYGCFWCLCLSRGEQPRKATLLTQMPFNLTTLEAVDALRISSTTLRRLRKEGILKPGIHFRAMGAGAIRSPLIWDGVAIDAELTNRSRRTLK